MYSDIFHGHNGGSGAIGIWRVETRDATITSYKCTGSPPPPTKNAVALMSMALKLRNPEAKKEKFIEELEEAS